MTKRPDPSRSESPKPGPERRDPPRAYRRALRLAARGEIDAARRMWNALRERGVEPFLDALIANDLAAAAALDGDLDAALEGFRRALAIDSECRPARLNLALLEADLETAAAVVAEPTIGDSDEPPVRVLILSFLFNWPSTGGGIVHTVELARFLREAGYEVRHVHARFDPWGVGRVDGAPPFPSEAIRFDETTWNVADIRAAFRRAVVAFDPDRVIVTDSWNSKPILAEAARGYPYILRLQALECLCPLNNVRLLPDDAAGFRQCPTHQLADPDACLACLARNGERSGGLHRAERALCEVGSPAYRETLFRAFREAEAVLVVNPPAEAMVSPHAPNVRVVTAGMDPARFPWPWPVEPTDGRTDDGRAVILFAGLAREQIKGFAVLREAGARLWRRRRDFAITVTDDPPEDPDDAAGPFVRYVGWQDQATLPRFLRAADVVATPAVAQEALGRTAVEAMAVGRPVIASRLGGLPYTVIDGLTGLLCEPGDPDDLAAAVERLLDDPPLRERLGLAGRRRFEERYAWPVIVERHYRPLLKRKRPGGELAAPPSGPGARTAADAAYVPFIPARVDLEKLLDDAREFFGAARSEVAAEYETYLAFHESRGYARALGELKTLCLEEAFVLYMALSRYRPRTIVEVGTQHGKSTRRILDIVKLLGLESRVICFDREDHPRRFAPDEAEFIRDDVTGRFRRDVLKAREPDLIFLDVHSHALLREAIAETLAEPNVVLAIHDCGRGLCNPRMTIAKEDPNVTSLTGVWERHVLAELFGVDDPMSERLDDATSAARRMRIFETPHGLALVAPRRFVPNPLGEDDRIELN